MLLEAGNFYFPTYNEYGGKFSWKEERKRKKKR
jgi:hypothetical protein